MKLRISREHSFGIVPTAKSSNEYMFLVIYRTKGFWEFPKGHRDEGEDDVTAAKR